MYNVKHITAAAMVALIVGLLLGWVLGVANTPNQKDEVARLQGQVASLRSEADKVSGLEKKLGIADASIKQAKLDGLEEGKKLCPTPAPAVAVTAPVCQVTAPTPARRAAARTVPVDRQNFSNPSALQQPQQQVASTAKHTCTAFDRATGKGEDFLDPSKNYRGIKVTTGAECKAAREQYKRDHPNSKVVSDDA